jgi:hypothetical protein
MAIAPSGKFFINKFSILVKKRIRQNWEGHHSLLPDFGNDLHKNLLMLDYPLNMVDGVFAIRKLSATE